MQRRKTRRKNKMKKNKEKEEAEMKRNINTAFRFIYRHDLLVID